MGLNGWTPEQLQERLYTELVGIDGRGGMKKEIREIKRDGRNGRKRLHEQVDQVKEKVEIVDGKVDLMEVSVVKKDECRAVQETCAEARDAAKKESRSLRDRSFMILKDIILLLVALFGVAKGMGWL